ncbi:hypothetical protein [Glutamicibacter sp. AOP33-2CA-4]|uniref:hypothetical protein n=1 Tax=Glutamicibacter sp. AOP33-2CA-4 TaxID=3457690 RepID=UPI0040335861
MLRIEYTEPAKVPTSGKYEHLLFARGYLLTDQPHKLPVPHWSQTTVAGKFLSYDTRIGLAHAEDENVSVTLLGHAIHIRDDTADMESIVSKLYKALLISRSSYLSELDYLSGRYAVIDSGPEGTWIQSDAVALRSIYWHKGMRTVSSHQNLVAEAVGGLSESVFASPKWKKTNKAFSYPGSETHWEGVNFLNANHELDLSSYEASRIEMPAPRDLTLDEAVSEVLAMMRLQLKHLLRYNTPVVSLTAGQDSRTTLAVLRPNKNDFSYFTYALNYSRRQRAVKLDSNDSVRIAREMGLERHLLMNIEGPLEDHALNKVMQRNSPRSSNRNVAARYLAEFTNDSMHIRSSFNEVGIAAYRTKYAPAEITAAMLSDILTFGTGYTSETLEATQRYIDSSNLLNIRGYDPLDLYYWELRMGSWLGNISHESDIAIDTHILINSRFLVRTILSAPLEDRAKGNVYHRLIQMTWPELYKVPVNSVIQKFPASQNAK